MHQTLMRVTEVIRRSIEVPGLGSKIKAAREKAGVKVTPLAKELGVTRQFIHKVEKEEVDLNIETLRKIESVLGVNFEVEF